MDLRALADPIQILRENQWLQEPLHDHTTLTGAHLVPYKRRREIYQKTP